MYLFCMHTTDVGFVKHNDVVGVVAQTTYGRFFLNQAS